MDTVQPISLPYVLQPLEKAIDNLNNAIALLDTLAITHLAAQYDE